MKKLYTSALWRLRRRHCFLSPSAAIFTFFIFSCAVLLLELFRLYRRAQFAVAFLSDDVAFTQTPCGLLAINGKHRRNLQLATETAYIRHDFYLTPQDEQVLTEAFNVRDASQIKKIPVKPHSPMGTARCPGVRGRRVLMNYADAGCCRQSQELNCRSGITVGGFDMCFAMSNWTLDDPHFVAKNCHLLSQKLWLWKPYLVFQVLAALDEGDFLFYSDSGSEFLDNIDTSLVCLQDQLQQDIVVFSLDHPEYRFTKQAAFDIMNCQSDAYRNSPQRLASFLLLRKSRASLRFVSEWLAYAQDERLLSNDVTFMDHINFFFIDPVTWRPRMGEPRNDQSVLSLLSKKWNIDAFPDPSQHGNKNVGLALKRQPPFDSLFDRVLIYHHRNRS